MSSCILPNRLFKYLPDRFATRFVEKGRILFRSLSYFRKIEDLGRSDYLEGLHLDYPDNPITIKAVETGFSWSGRAGIINSIKQDRVLVFCLSQQLSSRLYDEFKTNICVEIYDVNEFIRRIEYRINQQVRFSAAGFAHGKVEYYEPNRPIGTDITKPHNIPFLKHIKYSHQREYRLMVSLSGGMEIVRTIVLPSHDLSDDIATCATTHRTLTIGTLRDIVKVHKRGESI